MTKLASKDLQSQDRVRPPPSETAFLRWCGHPSLLPQLGFLLCTQVSWPLDRHLSRNLVLARVRADRRLPDPDRRHSRLLLASPAQSDRRRDGPPAGRRPAAAAARGHGPRPGPAAGREPSRPARRSAVIDDQRLEYQPVRDDIVVVIVR